MNCWKPQKTAIMCEMTLNIKTKEEIRKLKTILMVHFGDNTQLLLLNELIWKKSKNEPVKVVIFADSPFRDEKKRKNLIEDLMNKIIEKIY